MIHFVIYKNGYRWLGIAPYNTPLDSLPDMCRQLEETLREFGSDGALVVAQRDGVNLADSDGLRPAPWQPDPMYEAGLMSACGYHD